MRFALITLMCAGVLASTGPAYALACYELELQDAEGKAISMAVPPIGLMIGGNPVIDGDFPPHTKRVPTAPARCPAGLVENIRVMFNASCLGEDLRKSAAQANKVPIGAIQKGCDDMNAALTNADVEHYRELDKKRFPGSQSIFPEKPGVK